MFIGHFALGLAARRAAPHVSLPVLFAAAQFADVLWPVFLALGLEQVRIQPGNTAFTPLDFVSYPYSHSLLLLVMWGVGVGLLYYVVSANRRASFVIAGLVVSHWVLDFITHRPDMPLYPGGPRLGLGLWNSVPATVMLELALYGVGLWTYVQATRARSQAGGWGFLSFAVFLVLAYFGNLLGPPPPSVKVLYISALVGSGLLLLWSWWFDRHRVSVM